MIVSDTVGFISDLPTELVASFRATLEAVVSFYNAGGGEPCELPTASAAGLAVDGFDQVKAGERLLAGIFVEVEVAAVGAAGHRHDVGVDGGRAVGVLRLTDRRERVVGAHGRRVEHRRSGREGAAALELVAQQLEPGPPVGARMRAIEQHDGIASTLGL